MYLPRRHRQRRLALILCSLAAAAGLMVPAASAQAHVTLESAIPAKGSTVDTVPAKGSTVDTVPAKGSTVDTVPAKIELTFQPPHRDWLADPGEGQCRHQPGRRPGIHRGQPRPPARKYTVTEAKR